MLKEPPLSKRGIRKVLVLRQITAVVVFLGGGVSYFLNRCSLSNVAICGEYILSICL